MNKEFHDAVRAFMKRNHLPTMRQAFIELARQTGYQQPDKFYEYLHNSRRPRGDNRVRIGRVLRRRVEALWPVEGV